MLNNSCRSKSFESRNSICTCYQWLAYFQRSKFSLKVHEMSTNHLLIYLITHPTGQVPITGWRIGNEKKCSVLDVGGKPQTGENPRNQAGTEKPNPHAWLRVWGGIRTMVHSGERQGKKPPSQSDHQVKTDIQHFLWPKLMGKKTTTTTNNNKYPQN